MKITILDRLLLLFTCLLAGWQVTVGIDHADSLPLIAYTIGFGVLLVASLLLIILGFEALDSPVVVIASTIIPLSLSLGLVWEHLGSIRMIYLIFAAAGFILIVLSRLMPLKNRLPVVLLAVVHGTAGVTIFLLPIAMAVSGVAQVHFALVGLGGALIGAGGMLLAFLRMGNPLLKRVTILRILPGLLLLMTACFVLGFYSG